MYMCDRSSVNLKHVFNCKKVKGAGDDVIATVELRARCNSFFNKKVYTKMQIKLC